MNKLYNVHWVGTRRHHLVKLMLEESTTGIASQASPVSDDFPKVKFFCREKAQQMPITAWKLLEISLQSFPL